jgi:hypothetical protein
LQGQQNRSNAQAVNFKNELQKQLNFIITSCKAYDSGVREEAIRIALAARVLFHQTKSSSALVLTHLNTPNLRLRSTCDDLTRPNAHFLGFIGLEPSTGQFRPYLDRVTRDEQVAFRAWWEGEPIMKLLKLAETVTRRQLVLTAANQDGGAHVDPGKPTEYERLEDGVGFSVEVVISGARKLVKLRYANLAALRQIGHEILTSTEILKLAK